MFGLKTFVRVQTFRRGAPVPPRNFCNPGWLFDLVLFFILRWSCFSVKVWCSGTKAEACEGESLEISCQSGERIHVVEVMYGRSNNVICPTDTWDDQAALCSSSSSLMVVSDRYIFFKFLLWIYVFRCNDRERCSVAASNTAFGDPCFGVQKYLEVLYTCKPKSKK